MMTESALSGVRLPWHRSAELLLESVPGVVCATIEGRRGSVAAVKVWYEPSQQVGLVIDAVRECLVRDARARLSATKFQAIVAQPDRRAQRRARPDGATTPPPGWGTSPGAPLGLVGHKVEEIEPGVLGVEVWVEWEGRTFSGAAVGPDGPPGSIRTPALATLRAMHACLQTLYKGPVQPGLVLESALQVDVKESPVAVVALTASENARPRPLTGAWPEDGTGLGVVLATFHAVARTVVRWLKEDPLSMNTRPEVLLAAEAARSSAPRERRFALVDYGVDHGDAGDLDVTVRLEGLGEAVDKRRKGQDDDEAHLRLGASATLDAVYDLLRLAGWSEPQGKDLRHAGARRLRNGDHDIVVVLAEALMNGHWIPMAGATPADGGVERASITATLQATNALVAARTAAILRAAHALDTDRSRLVAQA